jgi:hypothetical protein
MVEVRRSERFGALETAAAAAGRGSSADPVRQLPAGRRPLQPAVMQRLHGAADAGLRTLGRSLAVALDVYRWRWPILLAAGVAAFLFVHDVRDWQWSLGTSMSPADEDSVFQRSALPWRFAWNTLTPVRHKLEEERQQKEEAEEKARIARAKAAEAEAARLAALAPQAPAEAPAAIASKVEPVKPPPPVPAPSDRLPPMARFVLKRQGTGRPSEVGWLLAALLQSAPRKTPPAPAAGPPRQAAAANPAVPAPVTSATPAPARSAPSRAAGAAARSAPATFRPATPAPQPEPAEAAAKEETLDQPSSFGAEPGAAPAPAEAEPSLRDRPARPEETPAPAKDPWWKRALKKTFKPRPPEGTPHGNG